MARQQRRAAYRSEKYIQGNTVRRVESAPDIIRRRVQEEGVPRRVSAATRRNRERATSMNLGYVLFLSFAAIIMFAVCVEYLHMRINLTSRINNISSLESQLQDLTAENDALNNKLNTSVDLEKIRKVAMEELGMVYPSEDQIVIYKNADSDYMNQYEDIPEKKSASLTNILDQ